MTAGARARAPRAARSIVVVAGLLVAAACGGVAPTGSATRTGSGSAEPSHTPGPPGLDWSSATGVERPEGMDAAPPSISPVGSNGGLGHPGHFSGQGNLYDVAAVGERLVAVGYTFPAFRGATWTSSDRERWSLAILPSPDEPTIPTAIVGRPDGSAVAVGRIGSRAAVWWMDATTGWTPVAGGAAFVEPPETRITAIVATSTGFVAAGWAGVITEPGHPRFWTSPDGRRWTRAGDPTTTEDGRVTALAAGPGGLLAVGTMGPLGKTTGSAAWTSPDGSRWSRVDDPDLATGEVTSVAAGGIGYVAVGADLAGRSARVWGSIDGRTWQTGDQDSLRFHDLRITMSDVTAGPDRELVAVGHYLFGTQYGQGTAWRSTDGISWVRMPDQAAFGQAEPLAVIPDGAGYVAAGTVGAPDNFIPTVWLSPSR